MHFLVAVAEKNKNKNKIATPSLASTSITAMRKHLLAPWRSAVAVFGVCLILLVSLRSVDASPINNLNDDNENDSSSSSSSLASMMASPRYAELVMQAQCQARCLAAAGELAFSSDILLLPVYTCTSDRCRQCSAPCDTDIINLVSPSTCKATKCSPFDKLCHESCLLRFRLKQLHVETQRLEVVNISNDGRLQTKLHVQPPEMLCLDDPTVSLMANGGDGGNDNPQQPFDDEYFDGNAPNTNSLFGLMMGKPNVRQKPTKVAPNSGGGKSLTLRWLARYSNNESSEDMTRPMVAVSVVTMRRHNATNSKRLTVIGKVVGQVITVTNLSPRHAYVFEVTTVTPDGILAVPVRSQPISVESAADLQQPLTPASLVPPTTGRLVTEYFYAASSSLGSSNKASNSRPGIGVYVHWRPDPVFASCYYDVFVLKNQQSGNTAEQSDNHHSSSYLHIRARTKETHNVLLVDGLDFASNYTVRVFTADRLYRFQSEKSLDIELSTPTCLEATRRNFSLCGPEPPFNATAEFFCKYDYNMTLKLNNGSINGSADEHLKPKLSLVVNWTTEAAFLNPENLASAIFELELANDPVPELIGAVDMPSDWKTVTVPAADSRVKVDSENETSTSLAMFTFEVDSIVPNQVYFVQLRTIFAGKRSRPITLRLASPGSRSSICSGDADALMSGSNDPSSDYDDSVQVLIANWTSSSARRRSKDQSATVFTELAISLSALVAIAIVIIGFASFWLRRARLVKQAKHMVETMPMKSSTLYEMTAIVNGQSAKFDRFEVNWTQLSLLPHVLGEGAFGKVIHGQLLAPDLTGCDSPQDVAVKMLRDNATDEERLSLLSEIETMKRVRQVCGEHPNVVSLLACVTRNGLCTQPALVMDLCPFGSLRDYLRQLRGKGPREIAALCNGGSTKMSQLFRFTATQTTKITMPSSADSGVIFNAETQQQQQLLLALEQKAIPPSSTGPNLNYAQLQYQQQLKSGSCSTTCTMMDSLGPDQNPPLFMLLLSLASQIAAGMEHLAVHKFVHRDLATRNVLVYDFDQVKISDFGLSRDIYEDAKYQKTTAGRLPIKWMAPEAIIDQMYTTASDVWSYGIVLWELVTLGATPYCLVLNQDLPRMLRQGHRLERPDNCPEDLYAIMSACWHIQASQRPTFTNLLEQIQALQSKSERSLATSVFEVDDYVTMKKRLASNSTTTSSEPTGKTSEGLVPPTAPLSLDKNKQHFVFNEIDELQHGGDNDQLSSDDSEDSDYETARPSRLKPQRYSVKNHNIVSMTLTVPPTQQLPVDQPPAQQVVAQSNLYTKLLTDALINNNNNNNNNNSGNQTTSTDDLCPSPSSNNNNNMNNVVDDDDDAFAGAAPQLAAPVNFQSFQRQALNHLLLMGVAKKDGGRLLSSSVASSMGGGGADESIKSPAIV